MKKIISLVLALLLVFSFAACSNLQAKDTQSTMSQTTQTTEQKTSEVTSETTTESTTESTTDNDEKKIKMTVNGEEVIISLYDTPAANSLYDMLPLDVTFEDFNSTEKIAYLTDSLNTDGEPDGCDPDTGDFCLYEPWGNLSVFYKDYKYSNSLVKLGKVESGLDILTKQSSNFSVTLEKVN